MIVSILTHILSLVVGSVITAVVLNNRHRKIPMSIIEEVDEILDKADDALREKWKYIRARF